MIPELCEALRDWFDRLQWKVFITSERVKERLGIQTEFEWFRDEFVPLLKSDPAFPAFEAGVKELLSLDMADLIGQTEKEPPGQ